MRDTEELMFAEIWNTQLRATAGPELEEVRTALRVVLRVKGRSNTEVMGGLRTGLSFSSVEGKVNEARLKHQLKITPDPLKAVLKASGDLILRVQNELPEIPRGFIDALLASEANIVVTGQSQSGIQAHIPSRQV